MIEKDDAERGLFARVAPIVGITAMVAILVVVVIRAVNLILLLFAAILLAVFLRGLSDLLSRRSGIGAGWSLLLAIISLMAILGGSMWLLGPQVVEQFEQLTAAIPQVVEEVESWLEANRVGQWVVRQTQLIGDNGIWLEGLSGLVTVSVNWLVYLLVVLVTGLYLAANPGMYVSGAVKLLPIGRRVRGRAAILSVGHTLRRFLLGRVVSMIAVGVLTGVSLRIINVPSAALLGVIAGTLTFVPYAGPLAAALPIAVVALLEGPAILVWALLMYTVIQWLEGFVITPLVQERAVTLAPAITLAAEVLMGLLFGAIGVVLSVPLAAAILDLVRHLYIEGVLGDHGQSEANAG